MNRDIKFRGKRVNTGEWVYGDLIHERYGTCIQFIITVNPRGEGAPERKPTIERHKATIDPATVGQYTGLKDKNGVEIYEGDILKIKEIQFDVALMGRCKVVNIAVEIEDSLVCFALNQGIYNLDTAEVIGNIHENPDLLEQPSC
jgi:uncharacterized phage protein (TIGR01671 family)